MSAACPFATDQRQSRLKSRFWNCVPRRWGVFLLFMNIPRKRCSTTPTFFQPACGVADYPSPGHFSFPPWWEASVWPSLQGQTTVRRYPVKSVKIMKAFCLMWRKFLICVIIRNSGRWDVISADPGASHLVPIYKSWEKDGRRTCIYCVHCSGTF